MVEFTVGSEVAGLQIGPVAGRGGSSIVYQALELRTGERRAAKVLTTTDEGARRRLQREAALLGTVDHPSVVPFRRLYQDDHQSVLITDWVEGQSLQQRLQDNGPLSPDDGLRLLAALADPLDYLHELGIVHRDITPANVIVGPDGRVTLIDLGIGHFIDASTLTNDDLLAGTPKYLAPEVIRGSTADARSDQYSVAVMLHELISGASPFPAADVIAAALHHQLSSIPTALDEIDPSVATPLSDAVLRALAKEPDERFDSMTDFSRAAAVPRAVGVSEKSRSLRPVVLAGATLTAAVLLVGVAASGLLDRSGEPGAAPELEAPSEAALVVEVAERTSQGEVITSDAEPLADELGWEEGRAANLACNLLLGHTFQNGSVPVDYYGNPPGREQVIDRDGFAGSWALEVGLADNYGQYGEMIEIDPSRSYLFRGWFQIRDQVQAAEFGVLFLDANYDGINGMGTTRMISVDETDPPEPGFRQLVVDDIPANAALAVPYLYKDSSPGVLLADELVFGPADECTTELGG